MLRHSIILANIATNHITSPNFGTSWNRCADGSTLGCRFSASSALSVVIPWARLVFIRASSTCAGYGFGLWQLPHGSTCCVIKEPYYRETFCEQVSVMNIKEVLSTSRAAWQRAYVDRVIASIRRECLDHLI